ARYCVIGTSLYFTAMANGNSKMYHSKDMMRCLREAGLTVEEDIDNIGISHTLFACRKR
ncbi:MAG TPA: SAM-dependent methyltransferase, partial [Spirochaetota bacterium]|nr:SAM-dependent methyltransferase [Spirochaetota bacterium]